MAGTGGLLLLLGLGGWAAGRWAAPPPATDIVLIVWDTCRGDRVTVNGYPHPTTPRLAELAASGTTFRRCYTPSPWTPPAHASLFTGLLPRRHGLREAVGAKVRSGLPLLAETLAAGGYETVAAVANSYISRSTGLVEGFGRLERCWMVEEKADSGLQVVAAVKAWVAERERAGRRDPFFLFVNLMETHIPYTYSDTAVAEARGEEAVNEARRSAREVDEVALNRHLFGLQKVPEELIRGLDPAYDGAVRIADRHTGRILDQLRSLGMLENALVVVAGDHGENLGDHGELGHFLSVHDSLLHVPLVISWPGRFEGGRVEDAQVRLQDLYPTILEAAGLDAPKGCGLDARTLTENPLRPRVHLAEYGPAQTLREMVRHPDTPLDLLDAFNFRFRAVQEAGEDGGRLKLLTVRRFLGQEEGRTEREELYDLGADPGELRNLLAPPAAPGAMEAVERLRALDR